MSKSKASCEPVGCSGRTEMGTKAEGDRMRRILIEYHDGKAVASEDREILDTMHRAALIDYSVRDAVLYARSSDITRRVVRRPWFGSGRA